MIELYVGTVGSGKSYHALVTGVKRIRAGGYVIANFPIRRSKFIEKCYDRWQYWEEITPEKLIAFSIDRGFVGREGKALLLVDEAGVMFNSRDWLVQKGSRDKWISFLSQSRKFGYDVILVAQSEVMIDKQIRECAEYIVRHRLLNRYWYFSFLPIKIFAVSWKWHKTNIPSSFPELWVLLRKYCDLYDSMRLFNMDKVIELIIKWYKGVVLPSHVLSFLNGCGYSIRDGKVCRGEQVVAVVK